MLATELEPAEARCAQLIILFYRTNVRERHEAERNGAGQFSLFFAKKKKHETGFEPAALALARRCSTTEPLVHFLFQDVFFFNVPSKPHIELHLLYRLSSFHSTFWISPRPISNSQLRTLLHFHLCPIYLVVFKGVYYLKYGISHLEGGFTLRCLQRLSRPDLATRP